MSRLGLLFSDASILVLPEGTDIDSALKEAEEHDEGEESGSRRTQVVRLEIAIVEIVK